MPLMVLPLITALVAGWTRILLDASSALGAGAMAHLPQGCRTIDAAGHHRRLPADLCRSALTAFITQTLVGGGQMLFMPMYIYQQSSSLSNWPFAAAISIIFLVAVLAAVSHCSMRSAA